MKRICNDCEGIFATFAEVAQSLVIPRVKPVRPVTTFRGILSIGDATRFSNTIQINVERYPKTKQGKVQPASKISAAAETRSVIVQASQSQSNVSASHDEAMRSTHQVVPSRIYKLSDGVELADRSLLEKGYNYGRTIVPVSKADEDFLQFESKASLQVLGFLDAGSVSPSVQSVQAANFPVHSLFVHGRKFLNSCSESQSASFTGTVLADSFTLRV